MSQFFIYFQADFHLCENLRVSLGAELLAAVSAGDVIYLSRDRSAGEETQITWSSLLPSYIRPGRIS